MILSDVTIEQYIDSGKIMILPSFSKSDIRPTGIRVHLGQDILMPEDDGITVDLGMPPEIEYRKMAISERGFIIRKDMFVLGTTLERIMAPNNIVCHLEGRSTVARLGLSLHCTSGIIDNNHDEPRSITLELKNLGPFDVVVRPGIPIGMLVFSELSHPIRQKSQSQYRNQSSVVPPDLHFRPSTRERGEIE